MSVTTASVVRLVKAQRAVEGDGFVVRRPFPTSSLSYLDPFLLFDHMGPVEFGPGEGTGTSWHPHRGFETVTYLLEGDLEHRDSLGNQGYLHAGDTQWMTAGSGVLHKEGPSVESQQTGGRTHGLQLWVNLPAALKMTAPAYQDLRADENAVRGQAARPSGSSPVNCSASTARAAPIPPFRTRTSPSIATPSCRPRCQRVTRCSCTRSRVPYESATPTSTKVCWRSSMASNSPSPALRPDPRSSC